MCAGLCAGETRIAGLPNGADVEAARALLRAVGVRVDDLAPAAVRVVGSPPGPHRGWNPGSAVQVGESGTLARFAIAALALCGRASGTLAIEATGSLTRRASEPLLRALADSGVEFSSRAWPIVLRPLGPPSTMVLRDPVSSQEVSALLLALAAYPDALELVVEGALPSRPYLDMTLAVLARFGVQVERTRDGEREAFLVQGPLRALAEPLAIEPDASLAAIALCAACLSGGELEASGVHADSLQGDVRIAEHLRAFGCRSVFARDGLTASGFPQHGARIDLSGEPDLAPPLAILAAGAALVADAPRAESVLSGLDTLPGKESSRIEVLADGLSRAGWTIRATSRELRIGAPAQRIAHTALELDPHGDHRMAFAFALLGMLRDKLDVLAPECVAKSWPTFWSDLERLGARVR